jgi:hypothetical protein
VILSTRSERLGLGQNENHHHTIVMNSRFLNIIAIRSRTVSMLAVTLGLFAFSTLAEAVTLTLDFADGNGTLSVDQYAGKAGNGWAAGWTIGKSQTAIGFTGTVTDDTPLYSNGGNYLKASMTSLGESATGAQQAGVRRRIDSSVIDLTSAFSYSFYFRADDDWSGNSAQYMIFSNSSAASGTSNDSTWAVISSAQADSKWTFRDGSDNVVSTMAVTAGTTYLFTINTNPATRSYTVSIFNGTTTYDSPSLAWRSSATTEAEFLHFVVKDTTQTTAATMGFSLDHLTIEQADAPVVPEPMTTALFLGTGTLLAVAVFRRRATR